MVLRIAFLVLGVFACSTAVIFIKESREHAILLSSYRLLVAAIALTPVFVRDYRKHRDSYTRAHLHACALPGVALGLHFISWIIGARMTDAVNASLIVNLVPIAMPFLMLVMVHEKLTRGELAGTVLAIGGLLILSAADYKLNREHFWGDVLCFVSMLLFSFYLALARKNRHFQTTWLYVVPLYYVAGIFCFVVALFFVNPVKPYPAREMMLVLALGVIPTVVGHSILNHSLKHLRGQVVSIVNMGQFIFAGIMAYIFLHEVPAATFYMACALVVTGAYTAIRGGD